MIKIALLDPHPVVHKGFKSFFRKTEHIAVVGTFSKTCELYPYLEDRSIDALILEMELAGDNAIQVIKKVKKVCPNTSIIIYTSLPQSIYGISLLKAGASGYLSKEANRKVMIEAIEKVVHSGYHITTTFAHEINNNIDLSRPRNAYETLSPREIEVLKLLVEGKRNIEIASNLEINQKTVNTYKTRLMKKLEVKNPVDLFQQARNFDLI
jgi:two-component system, NarL family, invasion response regulator UvrY